MKKLSVTLKSPVSNSFFCQKAADSLDIDTQKKSIHHIEIDADIESDYSMGLIIGASGSGKTTLAKELFGDDIFESPLKDDIPIIDQFPKDLSYDDRVNLLSGVGLTSVPCWIRPVYTLSNGQKARAEVALLMASDREIILIDEWTSVVDRTVAKVMSHCISKFLNKNNKKAILLSCHFDVVEWLNPDWIINCNDQSFTDRRSLRQSYERQEKLTFEVKEVDKQTWPMFSKYHYLSEKLPGGHLYHYGLFIGENQVGYLNFANYIPHKKKHEPMIYHANRLVIHPDYAGFGLGNKFMVECCKHMIDRNFSIFATFSSLPLVKALSRDTDNWCLTKKEQRLERKLGGVQADGTIFRGDGSNSGGWRQKVTIYSFKFIGRKNEFSKKTAEKSAARRKIKSKIKKQI